LYWASSIKIHRDRQLKNGSTALTRVPTATKENARPVQKFSCCRPKIMVE